MGYTLNVIIVQDEKLFAPTGDIGRWAQAVSLEFTANVHAAAPFNKRQIKSRANAHEPVGSLRRGISGDLTRTSIRQFRINVTSSASYTLHVLFGTSRIYAKSGRVPKGEPGAGQFRDIGFEEGGMYIPIGMGHKAMMKQSVSGQRANNFLDQGFRRTAATHSSLRSMRF